MAIDFEALQDFENGSHNILFVSAKSIAPAIWAQVVADVEDAVASFANHVTRWIRENLSGDPLFPFFCAHV